MYRQPQSPLPKRVKISQHAPLSLSTGHGKCWRGLIGYQGRRWLAGALLLPKEIKLVLINSSLLTSMVSSCWPHQTDQWLLLFVCNVQSFKYWQHFFQYSTSSTVLLLKLSKLKHIALHISVGKTFPNFTHLRNFGYESRWVKEIKII